MKKLLLTFISLFFIQLINAQTNYVWNGGTSTDWNTNTNWTPNGIPGAADNATVVTGGNNCVLAGNTSLTNLTITSGVLDLNGFTLNTSGVVVCNGGNCNNGTFNSTATSLTFAGTTFGADITASVGDVYFNGSTFNGSVTVTKTGAGNNASSGNNNFNGTTSLTNAGTGYFLLTNSSSRTDNFNGPTTFNTSNTGNLWMAYNGTVNINNNITFNNTASSGGIYVGSSGVVNLTSGNTLNCGTFSSGTLQFRNLTQTGTTAITLSPGNTGQVHIYKSTFTGSLTINAGIVSAQTSTFSAAVTYNLGGSILNTWSAGGNTYNGVLTVNNASSGYIGFANGTADVYNADVYANNTSTTGGRIIFGNSSTSQFNGDVYVSQSSVTSASGIALGWGGTYPVIQFAAGKKVIINGTFDSGYLQLYKTQQMDNTAMSITTTGTSAVYLTQNVFLGSLNVTTPDIYPYGGTYNGPVVFTKTGGGSSNHNNGNQNIFNSTLELNNQNGGGYLLLGYNSNDQFNDDITVTSIGSASGISFGWGGGTGTPVLAAGKTIQIGGAGYSSGYLQLGSFTQLGSTPINLTLTGTANFQVVKNSTTNPCVFGGAVTVTSPDIYLQGGTFNGATVLTKTGGTNNHNNGFHNIFNSTCTINQQSTTGYFMLGYNSNDLFNDDITVTNTGTRGIYLGYTSGTGSPTLASGKSISIGGAGFSGGFLNFGYFTQLGSAPVNLNLTGNAQLQLNNSTIGGTFTAVAPSFLTRNTIYNGDFTITKTGNTNDASAGGNTFNGVSNVTNSGNGYLLFGNGSADVFNSAATFNNLGGNHLYVAYNSSNNIFNGVTTFNNAPSSGNYAIYVSGYSAGTVFNDNIVVTSTSGAGVQFCYGNATATSTLATGKTITIGGAGFSAGYLMLKQFTQLGATPQALNVASGTSVLQLGPSSTFNGDVNFNFPRVLLHGTTYNGTATIQKNGATDDAGTGGNIFNGTTTITNSGSGYLLTGSTNADTFNGVTTFNNTGTNCFYFAHNHGSQTTVFNQPLTLNSNKSGGANSYSYFMCEGGNTHVNFNDDVTINNNGSIRSIFRFLQGTISTAQYNGDLTINLSNTNATGSQILLGEVGNSTYNGNITLNSTTGVTSSGIYFNNGSTASSTLSVGNTISIGGSGFTSGTLSLRRFTQQGTTAQNLTQTSGTAILVSGTANEFNGPVTFNFPQLNLISSVYNNSASIQKNGATNNQCYGGNTFNGTTHIINSHTANYLLLANNVADTYNGNITLEQQTTGGILYPNYNTNCTYAGDVTVTSPASTAITFGTAGNGRATFNGGNAQAINLTAGSAIPVFTRLTLNKSANDVTLNTKIFVSSNVNFTQGILNTTSTNILHVRNAATTNIGNSLSYVNGPMNYDMALSGSRTLTFPIGKSADWRPAVLDLRHNNPTSYTYNSEVFNSDSYLLGWSFPPTVTMSSHVHWWDITRTNTSTGVVTPSTHLNGNQTITLYYDANDGVTDPSNLTIIKNTSAAPTSWIDIGGTGATMTTGSVSSTSSPTAFNSFSRFTLGNKITGTNPLPIELLYFTATPVDNKKVNLDWATASEINNQQYEIERSIDGVNFEYLTTVKAYGNGNSVTKQVYKTVDEKPYMGISYYRLKQIDFSGEYKYADMVSVNITVKSFINFYPNPAQDKLSYTASEDFNTASIKIMNSVGAIVLNESSLTSYNGSIDLSHLANGIYYLVINQSDKSETIKISIQR